MSFLCSEQKAEGENLEEYVTCLLQMLERQGVFPLAVLRIINLGFIYSCQDWFLATNIYAKRVAKQRVLGALCKDEIKASNQQEAVYLLGSSDETCYGYPSE